MTTYKPSRWRGLLALAFLLGSGAAGGQESVVAQADGRFDEALERIARDFRQPLSRSELEQRALRALVADIDPYGRVLDATQWAEFKGGLSAKVAGVGVVLHREDGMPMPRIERLMIGSAAGAAGARAGDWIEQVDGRDTRGLSLDDTLPLLRGAPASRVRLSLRSGNDPPRAVDVVRKLHSIPSVHGVSRDDKGRPDYVLDPQRRIGYVRVANLAEDSVAEMRAALSGLRAARGCGLVLDLRGSQGGLMRAGIGIADLFLAEGLIAGTQGRHETTRQDADPAVDWSGPMVVLIDAETASSSEFLAAALRDHRRGTFVGQRTFGKGMVQEMFPLASGGGLILSTGRHLRPSGIAADRHDPEPARANAGVSPDDGLEIALEGDELAQWRAGMDLRASPAIVPADALPSISADRVLMRGLAQLATACLGVAEAR